MDHDLETMDRAALIAEAKKLRDDIRYHQSLDQQATGAPVHDKEYDG